MAEYLTNTTDLTKVASAIRAKGGTSDPLVYPDGFVTAIQAIQTGTKPEQTKTVNIVSNGTQTVTPDSGYVLSSVTLNVQVASGISGAYVGNYVVSDGILQFNVPQEDYENYRNYYIKKSDVSFGLFLVNIALGTQSDMWMVTHETSSSMTFSFDYVATSLETPYYKFLINLADSGAQYYDGSVEVYVITA